METASREEGRAKNGGAGSWTLESKALLSVTVNCVSLGTSLPFWKHLLLNATRLMEAKQDIHQGQTVITILIHSM